MIGNGKRAGLRATGVAMAAVAAFAGLSGAQAQMVVSAVESENSVTAAKDKIVSNAAGQAIVTTYGSADTRALTDYGVNKIKAQGNGAFEQYATSAWVDSYTVGGASGSMVDLSFTVSIDGLASFTGGGDPSYNFKLYALRGNNWTATGYTDNVPQTTPFNYTPTGDNLDRVFLNQTRADGGFSQIDGRDYAGINSYAPNGADVGAFAQHSIYDPLTDTYTRMFFSNGNRVEQSFSATHYWQTLNGVEGARIPLTASPSLQMGRANFVASHTLLGVGQLCAAVDNECGNFTYPGNDVTVSFSLLAGSTFSLAGIMFADDVTTGTVDFYNTARLTGIGISGGASLTSASGALVQQADGSYGYRAVIAAAAVPEPSTWAMLILGFGLLGGAMRRRESQVRSLAA